MRYLTDTPIDVAAVMQSTHAPEHGAVASFIGTVRDHNGGRRVVALDYSAYDAMAEQICGDIVVEAATRWTAIVTVQHRLGRLVVGDAAVVVAVAAPHRDAAFDACRWVIDQVKHRVPIWKHERYADGTDAWVDPTTSAAGMIQTS